MTPVFALAAEGIVHDSDTDALSLYNILEGVAAEGFPLLIQRMGAVALWTRSEGEKERWPGKFSVTLNGKELVQHAIEVNFRGTPRHRTIVRLGGLVVPGPG